MSAGCSRQHEPPDPFPMPAGFFPPTEVDSWVDSVKSQSSEEAMEWTCIPKKSGEAVAQVRKVEDEDPASESDPRLTAPTCTSLTFERRQEQTRGYTFVRAIGNMADDG